MKPENNTYLPWEEKKTEVAKDEMEKVAAGQLAAREISMDAFVSSKWKKEGKLKASVGGQRVFT